MAGRYRRFLRQRYASILRYVGLIGLIGGGVLLLPLLALLVYPEEGHLAWGFLLPGSLAVVGGYGLWKRPQRLTPEPLTLPEAPVIVVLGWLVAIALSTLPYLLLHQPTFTQA